MRKLMGVFLSMALVASTLAGCGGTSASSSAQPAAEATEEAEPAAEAEAAEPAAEAEAAEPAAEAEAAEPAAEAEAAEPAAEAEAAEPAAEEVGETVASTGDGEIKPLAAIPGTAIGGMRPAEDMEDPDELTSEDTDKLDRAMRAYTPPADSLLQNKAEVYHYYEQMTKDEQAMYDAMLMCASDPTTTDNIAVANISVDPTTEDFRPILTVAYWGLLYDHPALFWLYNATEADMSFGAPYEQPGDGTYTVYCYFQEPFEDFEEMMTKFNDAVDTFLEDIDLDQSDEVIAKDIHDKLINDVKYNTPVMEDTTINGYCNLAHTAYGALVDDGNGNANCAVCDGYSQAYVYLLEQVGIEAAVIVGVAGNTMEDAGGHAWSVVNLGGDWYEVDSTWDDAGSLDEAVDSIKESDPFSYGYYYEALTDQEYRDKIEHALCYVTTEEIQNYVPDEYYNYITKDQKYQFSLAQSSTRVRASEETTGYESYASLMKLAPIAEGVVFKLR